MITWAALAPIIAKYGLPFAMQLWDNIVSKREVTKEAWDELDKLADKTAADYFEEARKANPAG